EEGRLISLDLIADSQLRWENLTDEGRLLGDLQIGVDVAGPGMGGDESAFAVRRGNVIVELYALRGLTAEAHVVHVQGLIGKHMRPRDAMPSVAVDCEGEYGNDALRAFRNHLADHEGAYRLVDVRSSKPARGGNPLRQIDLIRDDLWQQLSLWMQAGGAVPSDTKLEKELHVAEWDRSSKSYKNRVIGKDLMRKALGGRSPDRADAVALACWTPAVWAESSAGERRAEAPASAQEPADMGMDPYRAMSAWGAR
ncbi:MAG: putative terminase protein, partial [Myxococcaceae bacterium]|nr:putative terminase protein [Myxococcaceae bacterium]